MRRLDELLAEARSRVPELMPWDLQARWPSNPAVLVLDVREPAEFAAAHIAGSVHVPRGVLEQACEWEFDDTVPALAGGRSAREVVVVCRSGNRSLLAAQTLLDMGFERVASLRTGVRGWNDADLPLVDGAGQPVDADAAEGLLVARVRPDQRRPAA
jgi:rhodanese-related sulfurtransferase